MLNIPNIITLVRLALVPVVAYFLAGEAYAIALPIFLVAALSDLADGYIARRFKLVSTLGAMLDPVAHERDSGYSDDRRIGYRGLRVGIVAGRGRAGRNAA